jgi:hypothetical protein
MQSSKFSFSRRWVAAPVTTAVLALGAPAAQACFHAVHASRACKGPMARAEHTSRVSHVMVRRG